jgi:uncharacterized lipoprotein
MHAVARRTSFAVTASALVVALVAGCGDSTSGSGEMGAQSSSAASSAPASAPTGAPVESATVDIRALKF